jgi:hypothetical protein
MEVSQIPAFGHLASLARKKYGDRQDEHQRYPHFISVYLPRSRHEALKSERSSVAGQGELKKMQFNLLFIVNHTCALLRADVNRLIRKTWCSTKDP